MLNKKNNLIKYLIIAVVVLVAFAIIGKKMGWITAWIESPNINYEEASTQICDSMYGIFDYIWGNKQWIGNSKEWKTDGQFHWYLYQWNTSIHINNSYCILN